MISVYSIWVGNEAIYLRGRDVRFRPHRCVPNSYLSTNATHHVATCVLLVSDKRHLNCLIAGSTSRVRHYVCDSRGDFTLEMPKLVSSHAEPVP